MDEMEDFDQNHESIGEILATFGYIAGGTTTLLIVISLIIRWIRQPEWRTPQAFITTTDLVIGTIVICAHPFVITKIADFFGIPINYINFKPVYMITYNLSMFSRCWSFCLPVVVYKQLACIDKPIEHVKAIATAFSVGAFILLSLVLDGLDYYSASLSHIFRVNMVISLIHFGILFLNILVHMFFVWKVSSSETLMKRDSQHTLTLVKVALMTQIVMFALSLPGLFGIYFLERFRTIVLSIRLLPLAIAVFRSKATTTDVIPTEIEEDLKKSP